MSRENEMLEKARTQSRAFAFGQEGMARTPGPRECWNNVFRAAGPAGDDDLRSFLDLQNAFDRDEWEWGDGRSQKVMLRLSRR
jgi:hypothetical protein